MAFKPVLESGERVTSDIQCIIIAGRQQSPQHELRLVLTNQAAYWPGHKLGLFDSVTTERMPIAEVVSVSLRTESYQGRMVVGGIMFVCGVIVAILLMTAQSWNVGSMKNIFVAGITPAFRSLDLACNSRHRAAGGGPSSLLQKAESSDGLSHTRSAGRSKHRSPSRSNRSGIGHNAMI